MTAADWTSTAIPAIALVQDTSPMTAADWTPIVNAGIALIGLLLTTVISIYVPKAIAAFQARTGVQVTDQERAAIYASAHTAAGIIETQLDQGALKLEHVTPDHPVIVAQAKAAIDRVPDEAKSQNTTDAAMAQIIVGIVDTVAHPPRPPVAIQLPLIVKPPS